MSLITDDNRREKSQSLIQLKNQGVNAVAVLTALKTNLANLKTTVTNGNDFDANDVADVQTIIDTIRTQISNIGF
jgi:hypothetical protein